VPKGPDRKDSEPPFLKRPVGYSTMGHLLGCLGVLILIVVFFLVAALLIKTGLQ